MSAVTKRQRDVLEFIEHFISLNRYSPSLDEVARALNLKSLATVHKHVSNLRKKGLLAPAENGHNRARALEVTQPLSMGTRFRLDRERLWDNLEKCFWVRDKDVKK